MAAATLNLLLCLFWISLLFLSGSLQLCIEEERKSLLSVRSGFPDLEWQLNPWKGDECCSWHRVGCNNITGHVIELDFSSFIYPLPSGSVLNRNEVHPSLFHLKHLEYLDISRNNLSGHQIPDSFGSLTQLQHLDFSACSFKGEIPYQLGNLSNLRYLSLFDNQISGKIPASFVHLRNLKDLVLSMNFISGEIPENIGNLRNIKRLSLYHNQIEGVIPKSLGNLSKMLELDLSDNTIFGGLPETIGNLTELQYLNLSVNQINGKLPDSVGHLHNLIDLGIFDNNIHGDITEAHFANLTNLAYMDISNNNLSVNVSQNWLPPFQAGGIIMHSCNLGPRFPPWLRNQTNLNQLDISNSGISGAFPDWFRSLCLSNMVLLFLSDNKLNGSIPSSICTQRELQIVNLANNDLSGTIPDCWGNASELAIIDISNNKLFGSISRTFGFLSRLQSLHMNNNSLSGTIPSTLQHCNQLVVIDLSCNKLSGTIPRWFGRRLSALRVLSLRSNNFTGVIPQQLSLIPSLQVLNLAHNNLFGSLPPSFGKFTSMMASQNTNKSAPLYGGSIYYLESVIITAKDIELQFTTMLSIVTSIDLSNNNLSGDIPTEITNLHGLHFLNLSMNHFSGNILDKIGLMSQLESLDLSKNNLSGRIPLSISALYSLSILNLSYNNLIGKIPTGSQLQTFTNLSYIDNPELCGEPLQIKCPGDNPTIDNGVAKEKDMHEDDEYGRIWYFIGFALGFVFGFWGFLGAVMIKRSTRIKYILIIDRICGWFMYMQSKFSLK